MRAIFISYRREDTEGQAGRLFADLVKHFGDEAVFMDVANIEPGRDFRKAIDEHVGSCGVLLSLVGKDWLDAKDAQGQRRLDDDSDFVRLETASALKRDIPVVPVLVHGARMPKKEELPADLQEFAFRNAIELTHARWDSDLSVLIKALSRFITPANSPALEPGRSEPPASAVSGSAPKSKMIIWAGAAILALAAVSLFLNFGKNEGTEATPREVSALEPRAEQAAPPPAATPPVTERNTLFGVGDWDKDGHQDFVSRQNSTGDQWFYPGDGKRGLRRHVRKRIGNGWNDYTPFGLVDWDGDGQKDVVTRYEKTGQLLLYFGLGAPEFNTGGPVELDVGWYGRTFFGAADWDGDGHQDLVARNDTSGDLVLYPGESVRGLSNAAPVTIDNGWKNFTFVGMADWDNDGRQDILARDDANGDLWLYPGEGVRRKSKIGRSRIGNGWTNYSFFGVADWDHDGNQDIVTRNDVNGDLLLYPGEGSRDPSSTAPVPITVGFDMRQ